MRVARPLSRGAIVDAGLGILDAYGLGDLSMRRVADMLGVQRTTVTAVARTLQDRGLIRYRRGVVDIVDREGLRATACECYDVVRRHYDRLLPLETDRLAG